MKHCEYKGQHKARVAALRPGESITVTSERAAQGLRSAALNLGLRVKVRAVRPPRVPPTAYKVTLR